MVKILPKSSVLLHNNGFRRLPKDNIKHVLTEVIFLYSLPISAGNKNGLIEIFETLAQFPNIMMMIKSGDYTVDAHSLIGVFSLDINKPIELILEQEPDKNLKEALSKFIPAKVS